MDNPSKTDLLKSVKLLSAIPPEQLEKLAKVLTSEDFKNGQVIFEEGAKGDALYFISEGHVRIAKKLHAKDAKDVEYKELAILGPGACFGEMALIDDVERSADAIASGDGTLLKLGRADLANWLKSTPELAMTFYARLVQILSGRLRNSSNELTLLFDLSNLLLEAFKNPTELLDKVMTRIMQYLEGDWCSGAYVYNEFNAEMELIDVEGDYESVREKLDISENPTASRWANDSTYQVIFPGKKRVMGYIVFHRRKPLDDEERNEFTRTITTSARLITAALENIGYVTEDGLRERLKKNVRLGGY